MHVVPGIVAAALAVAAASIGLTAVAASEQAAEYGVVGFLAVAAFPQIAANTAVDSVMVLDISCPVASLSAPQVRGV